MARTGITRMGLLGSGFDAFQKATISTSLSEPEQASQRLALEMGKRIWGSFHTTSGCMHAPRQGLSLLPNPTRCPDLWPCTQTQALLWPLAGSANGHAFLMRMMTESLFICASLVFVIFCRSAPSYIHLAVLTMSTLPWQCV